MSLPPKSCSPQSLQESAASSDRLGAPSLRDLCEQFLCALCVKGFSATLAVRGVRLASSTSERTKRGQDALDLLPVRLQPRREHELLAERGKIFVHGEARPVGRDLEQHAAGLEEVHRLEPEPVDHLRRPAVRRRNALANRELRRIVRHAPRDVMHAAGAPRSARLLWHRADVEVTSRATVADPVSMPAAFLADQAEAKSLDEKTSGVCEIALPQSNGVQTANLMVGWNRAPRPRSKLALVLRLDERKLEPVGIR